MSIMTKMPTLLVIYGSQTGTALDLAEELGRKARRRGFTVTTTAFDDYNIDHLPAAGLALIVVSTTGDGEEPDNMQKAWRFLLQKALSADSLTQLHFAVFGLGDSSYPKFNAVARRVQTRLKQLGARTFAEIALGDEQSPLGILGDFDSWCKTMWSALQAIYPSLNQAMDPDVPELEPLSYDCIPVPQSPETTTLHDTSNRGEASSTSQPDLPGFYKAPPNRRNASTRPFLAQLISNHRLTAPGWFQQTHHLDFDLTHFPSQTSHPLQTPPIHVPPHHMSFPNTDYTPLHPPVQNGQKQASALSSESRQQSHVAYQAGDVALVYPENPRTAVRAMLKMLDLSEDRCVQIRRRLADNGAVVENGHQEDEAARELPVYCTAMELFRRYIDIQAIPKRFCLEQLGLTTEDTEAKEKLLELASPEGADLYHEYCYREKRSFVEVLQDFPSVRPSLSRLVSLLPRIKPRAFSIASSCLPGAHPHHMHLCVAKVEFKTPYRRHRQGLCSSYLVDLSPGVHIPLWIRPGSFRVPADSYTPLIMVGPGTGVAPFKAMIEERHALRQGEGVETAPWQDGPVSDNSVAAHPQPLDLLFFGCRSQHKDFYYEKTWTPFLAGGTLSLSLAFSRDVLENQPRVYVQHRLKELGKLVWQLLSEQGASIFVAGSAKSMPTCVMDALKEIVREEGSMTKEEAERFVGRLIRARKYCVESWSG